MVLNAYLGSGFHLKALEGFFRLGNSNVRSVSHFEISPFLFAAGHRSATMNPPPRDADLPLLQRLSDRYDSIVAYD